VSAKENKRSANIPIRDSNPKSGFENPRSLAHDGQGVEGNSGETRRMGDSVPDGWSKVEFDNFTTLQRGKDLTKAEFREGTIPVAGSNGIIGYHNTAIAKAPGITVGRSGSAGKVTVYEEDFWPHNTSLYVRDFHGNDPYFAGFMLGSLNLARFKTGASVPTLDRNSFKTLPLIVPPLPEQKKIAHILSTVQRAIEAQERIIQTTTELKKALMHKFLTEGLRGEPQKQSEIGPIPESWELCKVGDVAKIQSGGTPTRETAENWSGGTIPWVKTGEINYCVIHDTEEKITPTGLANSSARLYPKGTLLMAMYGQGITRGRVGLLGIEAATNQACASITPTDKKRVSSVFLYYFFEYHYENLRKLGHGANQRNMNAALIRSFPLTFPKADEQAAVVRALESLDEKRVLHERKKTQLQDLFRTLLHELMNAKTRVHELDLQNGGHAA
jgi:type I restriction enzyme, S subunit